MIAELNHLPADASRTRFALGCSWAILLDHMRRPLGHDEPGRIARAAMGIAIGASSVLVAYGLSPIPVCAPKPAPGRPSLCWQRR